MEALGADRLAVRLSDPGKSFTVYVRGLDVLVDASTLLQLLCKLNMHSKVLPSECPARVVSISCVVATHIDRCVLRRQDVEGPL